jgi:hypothetical protein
MEIDSEEGKREEREEKQKWREEWGLLADSNRMANPVFESWQNLPDSTVTTTTTQ